LEGNIEKHVELTQITPREIPQHACARPPKRTTIATIPPPTEEPMTTRKEYIDLSVIEDRAYARATYTAMYLFTLDYVKRTKATYHDRWPTNDQVREWKARVARAWKYSTMAQREVWDMKAR
jgi:hypothetical protein